MELSKANRCTSAAFVGMATVVLSLLYRKKQTRIECSTSFWKLFWSNFYTNEDHEKISFSLNAIFNDMYPYLHINKPSNTIITFLSTMIDDHLNQIIMKLPINSDKKSNALHEYLQQHPIRILVPLCGSSYDLYYISSILRSKYKLYWKLFKIIGIDSSSTAIINFFKQNNMGYDQSCYNPKKCYFSGFYRVWMYSNNKHGIHIIQNDIFKYFELSQMLTDEGIASTPCFIKEKSIDIIIDINAMSCCNPSDRKEYICALKYWLSDKGSILLNTFSYDPKLSNYPPFTCNPESVHQLFDQSKCRLLKSTHCRYNCYRKSVCNSWLIRK